MLRTTLYEDRHPICCSGVLHELHTRLYRRLLAQVSAVPSECHEFAKVEMFDAAASFLLDLSFQAL